MRLLLDTHAYAWWATGNPRLSRTARAALEAPGSEPIVSAIVAWEIATKFRIGKWPGGDRILEDLDSAIVAKRLTPLPVTLVHARRAGLLPADHRDPFDRLLAAQAEIERAAMVTVDPVFAEMGSEVVW